MSRPLSHELPLPDTVTLLLHKTDGGSYSSINANIAVAAAKIGELVLRRRIEIDHKRLSVLDPSPIGLPGCDELLAEVVRKTGRGNKRIKLASLLQRQRGRFKAYRAALAETGLLTRTSSTFLGFIPYERYFPHGPTRGALLGELGEVARAQRPVDNRFALLTAVVYSGGLVNVLGFDLAERLTMETIAKGEHLGGAVAAAVAASSSGAAGDGGGDGGGGD